MKIYVVGSVASGKTTFSKKVSSLLDLECCHLDKLVHIKDPSNKKWGNRRRSDDEIDQLFKELIQKERWIVEDAGRKCFSEGFDNADVIVHLKPSVFTRRKRVFTRFVKQKLGLEYAVYTPNIRMLKAMYGWINDYEKGLDDLQLRLKPYKNKTIVLKHNDDINNFINTYRIQ